MPYLKKSNPYNPGYALPKNVKAEPERRGTFTTRAAPRGTIDSYRAAKKGTFWDPGFALPKNVLAEKPGQGVMVTNWAPKGTIDSWNRADFTKPKTVDVLEVEDDRDTVTFGGLGSLGDDSLGYRLQKKYVRGNREAVFKPRPSIPKSPDAISNMAKGAAHGILQNLNRLPKHQRAQAIKETLGHIDPGLVTAVEAKAKALRVKYPKMSALSVLERATSIALANHSALVIVEAGKTGRLPKSLEGVSMSEMDGPLDLSGAWDWAKRALSTTGNAIKDVASSGADLYKKYLCKVTSSSVGQIAAQGAAAYAGAPPQAGAQGAAIISGATCPAGTAAVPAPAAPPAQTMTAAPRLSYLAPAPVKDNTKTIMIVGGVAAVGLIAFMAMKKK